MGYSFTDQYPELLIIKKPPARTWLYIADILQGWSV